METPLSILRALSAVVVKSSRRPLRLRVRPLPFVLLVLLCAFSWPSSATAQTKDSPARFEKEIAAFEDYDHKNSPPQSPILFVGSSTIRLWQTADAFPELPVVNRGFGGSSIDDVNHFADRIVFKYRPRLIVFYSGDNDIAAGRTPDHVFADFETFANAVRERLPETRIIYLAIKPSIARWKLWPRMQEVNSRVNDLAQQKERQIIYIDTAPALLGPDGQPSKELFRDDGLHMNAIGYAAWNKLLAPHFQEPLLRLPK
jgi:lysophospholipase L1-like esterase